jgi:hypothetical protein
MSTNQILIGLGLTIVLALGCDLIASRTRLPAIVLLLPVGFIAGELDRRFAAGARIVAERGGDDERAVPDHRARLLAVVSEKGALRVASDADASNPMPGETGIWLI